MNGHSMIGDRQRTRLSHRSSSRNRRAASTWKPQLELLEFKRLLAVISDDITEDTTWSPSESPYEVTRDIDIDAGATLLIEPGTVVQFAPGARLTVEGQILAEGLPDKRIRFERAERGNWDGLKFEATLEDNRITYTDMIGGDAQGEAIDIDDSRLLLDHVTWTEVNATILELSHPSLIVRNSHFPVSTGAEIIHGSQITGNEYLILQGNVFENGNNGGDVIDFLGAERPGPVVQILDNVFKGGGDDGLDLDGTDAHIEGNLFMNFRKNTGRATTSNAIATGLPQNGDDNRTEITVVRNIFVNNDHALLLKEDAFATVENNIFIDTVEAVVQFNEVGGTSVRGAGKGADIRYNIFVNNNALFKNLIDQPAFTTLLTLDNNLLPNDVVDFGGTDRNVFDLGVDNFSADPMFVAPESMDFRLHSNSPAKGKGFGGLDLGAYVPAGGTIQTISQAGGNAQLQVGGPGVTHYRFRVDGGPLSELRDVTAPIQLSNLTPELNVEVVTMNSAGEWHTASTRGFGHQEFEAITPRRTRLGENLPIVVRRTNWDGQVDTLASEQLPWSGQADEDRITFQKGVGVVSQVVSTPTSFSATVDGMAVADIEVVGEDYTVVEVSGSLSGNNTWSGDAEYRVTSDLTLASGGTLTIEPGARVLLGEDVNFFVNGELDVLGEANNPVLFNALSTDDAWGGIDVRGDGSADINYAFFTRGGGDRSRNFGHSNSQPVLRASTTTLNCDQCFVIDNEGKGLGATNGFVNLSDSVVALNDTGGEFSSSVAKIDRTWVLNIDNADRESFIDDDNDGFYFSGAHSSGEPSRFADSFVVNTKDDGLDHNGARLEVERAWIQGGYHEGLASSNRNWARVHDSVFTGNNQGVEAGYGAPDLTVTQSVIVGNRNTIDADSPITSGLRFGDGYSNRNYNGQITASHLVIHNNGDNVRNWDNRNQAEVADAINVTDSLANDEDFADNLSGVPVFAPSMHLLRASAGFTAGPEGMPLGRVVPSISWQPGATVGEGDFDGNGNLDLDDLHLLCAALINARAGNVDANFDLTADGQVDGADRDRMVGELLGLTYGDVNLDGRFNSSDLVEIFTRGEFEDGVSGNSTWVDGDWNCDGEFTTQDIVLAFQQGGYTAASGAGSSTDASGGQRWNDVAAALAADELFGR